jgi:1-acylglycerone phosphate reductase
MECKPFDIDVVLVVPGAIRSHFGHNSLPDFSMPEKSFYKAYLKQILARINIHDKVSSLSVGEFAAHVVRKTLVARPPLTVKAGGQTLLWKLFAWLPRTWVLNILWRRLSKVPKYMQ